jgi:hypothetical protein
MKKDFNYQDISPRSERISKLYKRLDRASFLLKEGKYKSYSEMFEDLTVFENTQKEIEIQECYLKLEEMYYTGVLV